MDYNVLYHCKRTPNLLCIQTCPGPCFWIIVLNLLCCCCWNPCFELHWPFEFLNDFHHITVCFSSTETNYTENALNNETVSDLLPSSFWIILRPNFSISMFIDPLWFLCTWNGLWSIVSSLFGQPFDNNGLIFFVFNCIFFYFSMITFDIFPFLSFALGHVLGKPHLPQVEQVISMRPIRYALLISML